MRWFQAMIVFVGCVLGAGFAEARQQEWKRLAPFTAARFGGDVVEIRVDDTWVRLVAIDEIATGTIVDHARKAYRDRWSKRISEDLVEVLGGLGHVVGDRVTLRVADLDGTNERDLRDVTMTGEKRMAALLFNKTGDVTETTPAYTPGALERVQAERDVGTFFDAIETRFSYAKANDVDVAELRKHVLAELPRSITPERLGLVLTRALARFTDGHARVEPDPLETSTNAFLPFLTSFCGDRLVAYEADRSRFVDADRPYVAAIDGKPIAAWIEAAHAYVARGSAAYRAHRTTRVLRSLGVLREDLEIRASRDVVITLCTADGSSQNSIVRAVGDQPLRFGTWPQTTSRRLADGIALLRIEAMSDDAVFLREIEATLESFQDAKGLIIDVRGNGGGSRELLVRLAPHFLAPASKPVIANVAAKRLESGESGDESEGLLANRFLYPATSTEYTSEERAALETFARSFEPEWTLPEEAFSAWHYLVLAPERNAWRIECPVVVLQDGGCFSATDIFLGAFDQFDGVTLVGTSSGGGSGRVRQTELVASKLTVLLASMASFRSDGRLYDGRGVDPDVRVEPTPTDFIGATDTALDRAIAILRGK